MTYRRLRPARALLLKDAGLAGISKDGSRVTIGAMTPIADLEDATCAASGRARRTSPTSRSAERRRSAGTSAPAKATRRRAATFRGRSSRSARRCARRERAVSRMSRSRTSSRSVETDSRSRSRTTKQQPVLSPASTGRTPTTTRRSPLPGRVPRRNDQARSDRRRHARRTPSVGRGRAADPEAASQAALQDVTPHDDALASAWYRTKVLPVLVRRVLTDLQGAQ